MRDDEVEFGGAAEPVLPGVALQILVGDVRELPRRHADVDRAGAKRLVVQRQEAEVDRLGPAAADRGGGAGQVPGGIIDGG